MMIVVLAANRAPTLAQHHTFVWSDWRHLANQQEQAKLKTSAPLNSINHFSLLCHDEKWPDLLNLV